MGVEFQEVGYTLSAKNESLFSDGTTFCLSIGFENLTRPGKDQTFSVWLADTILVKSSGVDMLTEKPSRELSVSL